MCVQQEHKRWTGRGCCVIRPSGPRRPLQSHRGTGRGRERGLCISKSLSLSPSARLVRLFLCAPACIILLLLLPYSLLPPHTHTPSISFMHASHTLHCLMPSLPCSVLAPHNETMKSLRECRGMDRSRRRLLAYPCGPSHSDSSFACA